MDRRKCNHVSFSRRFLLGCCLSILSLQVSAAGVEVSGESDTSVGQAANGVAVVNIANPNKRGLSHNKYKRFNVEKSGLILNNSDKAYVDTQLGGKIAGNQRLTKPARVIINEVTSTHRSALEGYTEVGGERADIVIANPNGISVNGAGFINSSRVTLTTGRPSIDQQGDLAGFDVRGGEIRIEGLGLDTRAQSITSIYSHYLQLNASLHARNLDIGLGLNEIDYPGRKIRRSRNGQSDRLLLDSSALGGMYANKIVLVGTERGLGMNLPPQIIASAGNIEISADGHLELQNLDARGDIRVRSAQTINSNATVYAASNVEFDAGSEVSVNSGIIASAGKLSIAANHVTNHSSLIAGLNADGLLNDWGELLIEAGQLTNTSEIMASRRVEIDSVDLLNQGLINAGELLQVHSDSLVNEASLFSAGDTHLLVRDKLLNSEGAMIFAVDDLLLAADSEQGKSEQGKTGHIVNSLGVMQSLQGDIDIHARRVDNLGIANLSYSTVYFDLGNGREVSQISDAMTINLAYSSGYTKHRANARNRWIRTVLARLNQQAPWLYAANETDIRYYLSAQFDAIETRLVDHSTTTPAFIDSGRNLNIHVDDYNNHNSVTAAAGDINFDVSNSFANIASSVAKTVTDYQYYTYADHNSDWRSRDKYSSKGNSGYAAVTRTKAVSANTVTQAGGRIKGRVGGAVVNSGVLQGKYISTAKPNPMDYGKPAIDLPNNDFGLFVRTSDPQSRYLIETNPRFTGFAQFNTGSGLASTGSGLASAGSGLSVGSSYLLDRLDYAPNRTLKLLGDAFYESKLIRDNVFALTGRRFLDSAITDDRQQFQYLMDNALTSHRSLELVPGIGLNASQVNRLTRDIVWLVKHRIEGEEVLVPMVYLANGSGSQVRGGRILAGSATGLKVAALDNAGLIASGTSLEITADQGIQNRGLLQAQQDLRLSANSDITNLSGRIEAENIDISSSGGDIIHRRQRDDYTLDQGDVSLSAELLGEAGVIQASGEVNLEAAGNIDIEGSIVSGRRVSLDATGVAITASSQSASFSAGNQNDHFKKSSTRHVASLINGQDIVILTSGNTRVSGSTLTAVDSLSLKAGSITIDAVNDSESMSRKDSASGFLSESVESRQLFRSRNVGSELNAATVVLITEHGDIELTGSAISATDRLAMTSTGGIRIQGGREVDFEESHERKSGWLSGSAIYSESEDLQGYTADIAVNSRIKAGSIALDAADDIEMIGVDIVVAEGITANASNITLSHATSEETRYSKHTEIGIGVGNLLTGLTSSADLVTFDDGQLKVKLADAEYEDMESVTRQTTVLASQIQAGSVHFNASAEADGNIRISGSDIVAEDSLELNAVGDIALLDAHHTYSSDINSKSGTAEVYFTLQNEYEQSVRAIDDVRDAKDDLSTARKDYDAYKQEREAQRQELVRLQEALAEAEGFIEQADVDELERGLKRLEDDQEYYRANILLATVTLASKTSALIEQTARAAASSATYGFNASIELDIDAIEREVDEYYQQSRASLLSATSIAINAGDTALLRGSDLQARESIDIEAGDIEILAGVYTSSSSERNRHVETGYRWDLLGSSSTQDTKSLGGNIGGDEERSSADSEHHRMAQLRATNIRLNATGDTTIRGAEIEAAENLKINTDRLVVASVQDTEFSQFRSEGLSYSGVGAGLSESDGDSETVRTQVTRLSGQQVEIQVADHTELQGAVIAAVDSEGRDNGQLSLTTNTLNASSMNNTTNGNDRSSALSVGETSNLDYQSDQNSDKTKSLATLGKGDIHIDDLEGSDTRFLNDDITNTEVAIYDIESHQGLSGEIDTRLLSETGRDEIVENWIKTEMIGNAIKMIATNETVDLVDYFSETRKHNDTYDALKQVVAESPELAAFLQNPAITSTQKEQLLNQLTAAVMIKLEYDPYQNQIIATDDTGRDGLEVRGFYSTEVGQAFINDRNIASIDELVAAAGHEATRAMDHQEDVDFDSDRQDRTDYAENYGNLFSAYTDQALDMAGYDAGISQGNLHVDNDSQSVNDNNAVFSGLDKSQGDNFLQHEDKLRYVLLTDALDDCRTSGSCSDAQMETMLGVAVRLLKEDRESDQKLANACRTSSSSPACRAEVKKLKAAFDTYKDLPVGEPATENTWSEYIDVGYLYGTYRSEAYSENALRATETMTREAVSAAGELTLIAVKAGAGNETAQQQLAVIAENIKALVQDPVGTVEQGIKSQLDEADRFEAEGDINKAEEIRSQVFLEGAFAVAGLSSGAVSVIRHGVNLTDLNTKADGDSFEISTQNEVGVDNFDSDDFRPLKGVGADGAFAGLPTNYKYVVDPGGEHVIQGPRGGIYQPTDLFDLDGNPLYENSGKLYSMEESKKFVNAINAIDTKALDLSKIAPPKGRAFEGTLYRFEKPERTETTWNQHKGNIDSNHRYTKTGDGGVYGGTSEKTAFDEVKFHGVEEGRVSVQLDVKLTNILDLTDAKVRLHLGIGMDDIVGDNYNKTHQIGNWAREQGFDGILAPSARNKNGTNIVILEND